MMPPMVSKCGTYDYDLLVMGGGSGGLSASKEATTNDFDARVIVFDYVKPSPQGTTWGLGGTCVNVGCIPKKLFHYSGLIARSFADGKALGWKNLDRKTVKHDWGTMVKNVNDYIKTLNDGYVDALQSAAVEYKNNLVRFVDAHTAEYNEAPEGKEEKWVQLTFDKCIVAVGGRPSFPSDCPGAQEFGISSDDIFWKKEAPGKTLCVGASYIALECAGFLHEMGYDTTVCVRSILLRGFDRQVAAQIGETMEREGMKFLNPYTPCKLERKGGATGPITVTLKHRKTGETVTEDYDTVVFAIGRHAVLDPINADKVGLETKKGKLVVNDVDQTNVAHIYAIGDVQVDRPELTPVAIQAGRLLARRLFGGKTRKMDYLNIPTTVFTPHEYGAVGYSEEDAIAKFGDDNVEVFASRFGALETAVTTNGDFEMPEQRSSIFTGKNLWAVQNAEKRGDYFPVYEDYEFEYTMRATKMMQASNLAKLVVEKKTGKVVGFHYLGPNAAEITQGYALGIKAGCTKEDFDDLVGIHPSCAEEFTTMYDTSGNGPDAMKAGGC